MHDGTHLHMRCCAPILNLIVKIGLDVIKGAIENVRESVTYWIATPKRVENFEEACKQLKIAYSKKLCLDCQTRWNSTYLMLKTALIYKDVFASLKQRETQYKNLPSQQEWENAQEICERLKLFYDVTSIFSGRRYPTANLYFPKICEIRLALSKWIVSSKKFVRDMASQMTEKFDEYWDVIHQLMGVAAVFDPRKKMEVIEVYFKLIYPLDSKSRIEEVKNLCTDLEIEYKEKMLRNEYGLEIILVQAQLIRFVSDENLSAWDKHILSKSNTLQSTVSTVASESAFSASGRLISPHRSRLHPDTIEALMCAQSWLWENINKGKYLSKLFYNFIFFILDT